MEEWTDFYGIYQLKSKSCNDAIATEARYSIAFADPRFTEAYHKFFNDRQNPALSKKLEDIKHENGITKSLEEGKTISSSYNYQGYHKYTVQQHIDCTDAQSAINDPALMSIYVSNIPGYSGVILPDHPLHASFSKEMTPSEYISLKKESAQVIRDNTADLLRLTAAGDKIPVGTIIILHSDMVKVSEYIMDGSRQQIRLTTTEMHTFRDGDAWHSYEVVKDRPNTLLHTTHGEGTSPVSRGGGWLNNTIANFMWPASPQIGTLAYRHYKEIMPKTDQERVDFVKDKDRSFATLVSKNINPQIREVIATLKILGYTMGHLNLHFVTWMAKDIDGSLAEAEKDRAEKFDSNALGENTAAKWRIVIDDQVAEKLQLPELIEKQETMKKIYELSLKADHKEPLPKELEGARPGPYSNEMGRMGPLGDQNMFPLDLFHADPAQLKEVYKANGKIDLATLTASVFKNVPDVQEKVMEKMSECIGRKSEVYLSDEVILKLQQEHSEAMKRDMDKLGANDWIAPSDMKHELTKSGSAELQAINKVTELMNKARDPVLQVVHNFMKERNMQQAQLPSNILHNQLSMRFQDCMSQNIYPSFTDYKTGLFSQWTDRNVVDHFTSPKGEAKYGEAILENVIAQTKYIAEAYAKRNVIEVHEKGLQKHKDKERLMDKEFREREKELEKLKKELGVEEKEKHKDHDFFEEYRYTEKLRREMAEIRRQKEEQKAGGPGKEGEMLHHQFKPTVIRSYYEKIKEKKEPPKKVHVFGNK